MSTTDQLRSAASRVAAILDGADGSRRIPRSEWTVAEAASHLAVGTRTYIELASGVPSPIKDMSEVPAANAEHLANNPERDLAVLRPQMLGAVDELIAVAAASTAPIAWHGGVHYEIDDLIALDLGEYLIHGYDIAQALGRPWTIDPDDARRVLVGALPALPLAVDAETAAGLTGVVEVRIRGGVTRTAVWDNGSVSIRSGAGGPKPDCIVSADPVAFLLASYGRGSKWKPILTGKVVAYGRKPLLALKMQNALRNP